MEAVEYKRVERKPLEVFCQKIFECLQLSEDDAKTAASVLVAAEAMGIPSHGVGRLWRYVSGLKSGLIDPRAPIDVLVDTPASLVLNANGGMGAPVSVRAMNSVIEKANTNGFAFGCVCESNHFGIAGYYARMALPEDMIGIAMTNTSALAVPTFGRQVMFGTNPLAFAAPADQEPPFVLDMSTTVVTRGKIEVYDRLGKELPVGWAVDKYGRPARNARSMLDDMFERIGGGNLPLGGIGKEFGGHKGYGLAVMIDILCAVLCGAAFGPAIADIPTSLSDRVSHFFGAMKIANFRNPQEFRRDMDKMLRDLKDCPPAEGQERVYVAGQPEYEKEQESARLGVQVLKKTYDELCKFGEEFGVEIPPTISDTKE
ncbi:Ldh family oxidoreductase [candidate division KSB3 bacterium]|uniref:Ldh family oxidoreductase n=1 Tax=candidate division KSB3 bacterium TaxID=2044937 RepID=A0A9D5JUL4_9BACT|nr:Ldh family oxidoreductase [candidate division KSB3 bacterium]MBD3324455.1 Ldh family oxidoreductase [candidate division KSB3 bacterium]